MNKFIAIIFATLAISFQGKAQTIQETKDFINQQIELNPINSSYSQGAMFLDQLDSQDKVDYFTKKDYPKEQWEKTILITKDALNRSGNTLVSEIQAFNVLAIKNIVVTSASTPNGANYNMLTIFLKEGMSCVVINSSEIAKSVDRDALNRATIYIKYNPTLAEKMQKAFILLSQKFGGTPQESSPF